MCKNSLSDFNSIKPPSRVRWASFLFPELSWHLKKIAVMFASYSSLDIELLWEGNHAERLIIGSFTWIWVSNVLNNVWSWLLIFLFLKYSMLFIWASFKMVHLTYHIIHFIDFSLIGIVIINVGYKSRCFESYLYPSIFSFSVLWKCFYWQPFCIL